MAPKRPAQSNWAESKFKKYKDCGSMVAQDAAAALAGVRYLKKMVNVEYKSINVQWTVDPNSSGAVLLLTTIAQGDDFSQRQGRKARAHSLRIQGMVEINGSASATNVRMMVVRDNNGSTTAPAIGDLFANVGTFIANNCKIGDAQSNSRFTVLYDKFILLDAVNKSQAAINRYIKLNHHLMWTGTAATDEGKGHLWLFIGSNEATNDPVVTVLSQFKWIDN